MDPLAELVGESPAIETVRDQIRRLVAHRETGRRLPSVLLQGETGSGKGLVARVLHRAGPRARAPFVDLNCAAMPEHLVESELFGYERGAFTDARRAKPGLFQTAHRGVIFLDEIGELREPTQAKLLKVLEEGVVRRLGATETEPADVWVISATNADLEAAVRQRAFREDLYHRLAVLTLRLPPLRERGRDVILLARRFLAQACTEYGLSPKRLSPDAEARLLRHPWPGQYPGARNVMERVALLAEAAVVTGDMLELHRDAVGAPTARPAPSPPATVRSKTPCVSTSSRPSRQTGWNISRTAALPRAFRATRFAHASKSSGLRHTTAGKGSARRPVKFRRLRQKVRAGTRWLQSPRSALQRCAGKPDASLCSGPLSPSRKEMKGYTKPVECSPSFLTRRGRYASRCADGFPRIPSNREGACPGAILPPHARPRF